MGRFVGLTTIPLALLTVLYLSGCNGNSGVDKKDGGKAEDHHHAHGPHGGALVELGSDEKYHAEWATDENGKVTIWILDGAGEKELPIAAENVTIATKDLEGERAFDLAAVNQTSGDKPTAFQFEIEGAKGTELLGILETLGGEITATLKVDVGEPQPREGKIEKHEHKH